AARRSCAGKLLCVHNMLNRRRGEIATGGCYISLCQFGVGGVLDKPPAVPCEKTGDGVRIHAPQPYLLLGHILCAELILPVGVGSVNEVFRYVGKGQPAAGRGGRQTAKDRLDARLCQILRDRSEERRVGKERGYWLLTRARTRIKRAALVNAEVRRVRNG